MTVPEAIQRMIDAGTIKQSDKDLVRHCRACGEPERIDTSMGVPVSNMTKYSCLCVNCINAGIKEPSC
jgi:hypothetical protein